MMNRDKGVIRIGAIIILIAVVVIYSLVNANRKTAQVNNENQIFNTTNQNGINNSEAIILPYNKEPIVEDQEALYTQPSTDNQVYNANGGLVQGRGITKITNEIIQETETKTKNDLPGTAVHIGGLASLQTLGIDPVYILKDQQEAIYYIPLDQDYDRGTIASRYNGNVKEIVAQTEIQSNQLWGDKVTFINLPQYAGQLVLMVVETNNQQWLLQIDYASYHANKQYMKQRFN